MIEVIDTPKATTLLINLPELVPGLGRDRNTEMNQLGKGIGKVLEEGIFIFGILLDPLFEFRIINEGNVRRQHHQLASAVLVL
jgi:hypothetical protein